MPQTMSYKMQQTIQEVDEGIVVYRAIRKADQSSVILKVMDLKRYSPIRLKYLKREFEFAKNLAIPAVLRPLAMDSHQGMPALVLEGFSGNPLNHYLASPLAIENFLRFATSITKALAEIHHENIIHKDLKPQNIFIDPITMAVKITGFGLASHLPREQHAPHSPKLIEGSLPYMSPEQTGRMNASIDNRSDLYSLGITFYEMLSGHLPFDAYDSLEWIHCHVARAPVPLNQLKEKIPKKISDIVMRLLTKLADERYQTAEGLLYDLEQCLEQWLSVGQISEFPLGKQDILDKLIFPQKLYGRDKEISQLMTMFKRVVSQGFTEFALISGYSGIGKSSLVNELNKPVIHEHGFFVAGKFDQYKREIPYSTFIQAFRELILMILVENEEKIKIWKDELQLALGMNGQLIIEVIPELKLLIGEQTPVPPLPLNEAQNRFRLVFLKFIEVFTQKDHPVVLFLDDLQWMDSASLYLLRELLIHEDTHHLLIIGAYRDNEVSVTHPLSLLINELRKSSDRLYEIKLGPLSIQDLRTFVSDTLHSPNERTIHLADLVHEKTAGNPFFTIQFLTALCEERLLTFNRETKHWDWDTKKIHSKGFTDNVINLIMRKIKRLPESTQVVLKSMAYLGNIVEIDILKLIHGGTEEEIHFALRDALSHGVLFQLDHSYKFVHDRIHEAAHSLVEESKRNEEHLRIGRIMVSNLSEDEIKMHLFDVVGHLNHGVELITESTEKVKIAAMNLIAAKRAKNSTAYSSAAKFCIAGMSFLGQEAWNDHYDLMFNLALTRSECELAIGKVEEAERQINPLLMNTKRRMEKASVWKIQIDIHTARGRSADALNAAFECLKLYNLHHVPHPSLEQVEATERKMWASLGKRPVEVLIDLPVLKNPDIEVALSVLAGILPSAYFTDLYLHRMIACEIIELTLMHGLGVISPMGFAAYGLELCVMKRYREADRFGSTAIAIIKRHGFIACEAKVFILIGGVISIWTKELSVAIEYLNKGVGAGVENGDIIFACLCKYQSVLVKEFGGANLAEIDQEAQDARDFINSFNYEALADTVVLVQRYARSLQGKTGSLSSFSGPDFDEEAYVERLPNHPLPFMGTWYHLYKLQVQVFAGDSESAITSAFTLRPLVVLLRGQSAEVEYAFYTCMAITGAWNIADQVARNSWKPILKDLRKQLQIWSKDFPRNFLHRYSLVSAEIARIEGKNDDAGQLFEKAVKAAQTFGFTSIESLALERAALFYQQLKLDRIADMYLREASKSYARWGALGKVKLLEEKYPQLKEQVISPSSTFEVRTEQIDLLSAIKASQAISSNLVLSKLIPTLLKVVLEQSGAQNGCLLLQHGKILSIEAIAQVKNNQILGEVLIPYPIESTSNLPESVIRYVQRTKSKIIFDNASQNPGKFEVDEYIRKMRPKSLLCLPILRESQLIGILYLENNITSGVFSADRLTVLELLAAQAAISLQNAQTQEALHASQDQLQSIIDSATAVIYMKDTQGKFLLTNRKFNELFNKNKTTTLLGKTDYDLFPKEAADKFRENDLMVLKSKNPIEREETAPHVDGIHTYLSVKFPLFSSEGVPYAICGISTDITDRKRSEYEREQLLLQKQEALTEAKKSIEVRDDFISIASHELRTPLTPLRITISMAMRAMQEVSESEIPKIQNLRRLLEKTDFSLNRLTKLTEDLLDVSRITAGRLVLHFEEVNLSELLMTVLNRYHDETKKVGQVLNIKVEPEVKIRCDSSRIEQVIENLITNAMKYGELKPIEISLQREGAKAIFFVKDYGIGIKKEQQNIIFERFMRAAPIQHYGGLGLGLYISKEIIMAHGGRIYVKSEIGKGSTFTVELPGMINWNT